MQLQEIFRKKNEKKGRKGDAEKSAQLVRKLVMYIHGKQGQSYMGLEAFVDL